MVEPSLKLVKPTDKHEEPSALRFEQRRAERHQVAMRVTAVTRPVHSEAGLPRIRSLQLSNLSDGGIGAVCQDQLDIGSTIAVFIPPHGPERGLDVYGQVVRCIPKDYGFEVGVAFGKLLAA